MDLCNMRGLKYEIYTQKMAKYNCVPLGNTDINSTYFLLYMSMVTSGIKRSSCVKIAK